MCGFNNLAENKSLGIMLFVLGLFLILVGIGLALYTTTETYTAMQIYGVDIPSVRQIKPYAGIGVGSIIFGAIALVGGFVVNQNKKPSNQANVMPNIGKLKFCYKCNRALPAEQISFCPFCGESLK